MSLPLNGGTLHASAVSFKEDEEDKAKEMNKKKLNPNPTTGVAFHANEQSWLMSSSADIDLFLSLISTIKAKNKTRSLVVETCFFSTLTPKLHNQLATE